MRLLVVNPNTSEEVTQAYVAKARRIAPAGVEIQGVTGRFGARIVTTEAENLIAAHSALALIAEHARGFDGVILAISFDTAKLAASELLPMPVVGITEAALTEASADGRAFGAIIFGASSRPLYSRLIAGYGISPLAWDCVEFDSAADYFNASRRDDVIFAAVDRLARAGAEAVVILGAAVVGVADRLAPRATIPLFDGAVAVALCVSRVDGGEAGPPRPVPVGETLGLSAPLTNLIAGNWQREGTS
ncbi:MULTISPECIES: aspartate/glutamate racemase family protein [Falsihalocynthiibacter]|uniref:aspartate/glutamate racemase family protein n=1 Tax=Falsihalocynthiibacter TaxID=2854182 RepID=UPI003001C2E4